MPDNEWILGETPRLSMQLLDADDIALDPDTIELQIEAPDGSIQTIAAPEKIATGSYRHHLPLTARGNWYYRWQATATIDGAAVEVAAEGAITVRPSRFPQT